MGYEPRLYIGKVHLTVRGLHNPNKFFFEQVASIEVPGILFGNNYLDKEDKKNACFLFLDGDGDQEVIDDKYGRKLCVIPAKKVLDELSGFAELKDYPMLFAAQQLLNAIINGVGRFYDIGVVIYGH